MSARVTNVKATKAGQRVWFRCDECGAYGDCSGAVRDTEHVVGAFAVLHVDCSTPAVGGTS